MNILDCTLRDGGYYTNWDFPEKLVDTYCEAVSGLPIAAVEVGYRSKALGGYYGKYFHCPSFVLKRLRASLPEKKIAVMINQKDVDPSCLQELISPITGDVDMVRFAVDPAKLTEMPPLLKVCKDLGFETATNLMYASKYREDIEGLVAAVRLLEGSDYVNLVDSYGGLFPSEVGPMLEALSPASDCSLGFHGHNNLELGFANGLAAVEHGATWLDSTITGMGRGAGNLKTELLLTHLAARDPGAVNLDLLSSVVQDFESLRERYGWGTNLPYMLSGASSLPQKDVMDWVTKRYYSMNAIVHALENQREKRSDNFKLEIWDSKGRGSDEVLIVGGGSSVSEQGEGLLSWIAERPDMPVIHSSRSSRNPSLLSSAKGPKVFCLAGNEGALLEPALGGVLEDSSLCLLPPYPRPMGTSLPPAFQEKAYELEALTLGQRASGSTTAVALEAALALGAKIIWVVGYDGYPDSDLDTRALELFQENEQLFAAAGARGASLRSLTPTAYQELEANSIYVHLK